MLTLLVSCRFALCVEIKKKLFCLDSHPVLHLLYPCQEALLPRHGNYNPALPSFSLPLRAETLSGDIRNWKYPVETFFCSIDEP